MSQNDAKYFTDNFLKRHRPTLKKELKTVKNLVVTKTFQIFDIKDFSEVLSFLILPFFILYQIIISPFVIPYIILRDLGMAKKSLILFIIRPSFYAIINPFLHDSTNRSHSYRIAQKQKINPGYKKIFSLILKRYKERSNKKSSNLFQYKRDLDESFGGLIYLVLIIAIFWTLMNTYTLYSNFFSAIKTRIETHSNIIDLIATEILNSADNYFNYIGDRTLVLNGKNNQEMLKNIIKRTPNRDILQRNISSWLSVKFVNTRGIVTTSTYKGILKEPYKPEEYYPVKPAIVDPWRFKVGKLQHFENDFSSYDFLPIAMAIDTDDFSPIGTMISEIPTDRIQHNIRDNATESDLCYIVIDKNYDLIAKSLDIETYDRELFRNNAITRATIENKVTAIASYIKSKIKVQNCDLVYYRGSGYGITTFVGYDNKKILENFTFQILISILQSVGITSVLLLSFYIFRKLNIAPFLRELFDAKMDAEEANQMKSRFLSNMSHELRTPMNGILGMSQALRESEKLPNEELDQANVIYRSADALLLILNDILNFSKIEARKVSLEEIDFNITTLLDDVTDLMSQAANNKGLEVISYIDPNVPIYLNGDPGRIRQILTNLINNAIKFTSHGQVFVHVKLNKIEGRNYFVNFNVHDSGIGIEQEKIGTMFTRFNQADSSTTRKYGGTGLGLSICKELVELMHGHIDIESDFGKGSNFWFTIVLSAPSATTIDDEFEKEKIQKLQGKRIGFIGSNMIMRNIFGKMLSQFGIIYSTANIPSIAMTGKEITQRLLDEVKKFNEMDMIFVDYNSIIEIDSVKIANYIKEIPLFKNTSVIFMASTKEKPKLNAIKPDFVKHVMLKPLKTARILETLFASLNIDNADSHQDKNSLQINNQVDSSQKIRLLLCEDNEVNTKVALIILKRFSNIIVDTTENGQEAINKFTHIKYDIVLMDCMMPIIDGYQATAEIRKIEKEYKLNPVTIIALTANATEEDRQKCFDAGMDDFISKPIKRESIEECIKKWQLKTANQINEF